MNWVYEHRAITRGIAILAMELNDKAQNAKLACRRSMKNLEGSTLETESETRVKLVSSDKL